MHPKHEKFALDLLRSFLWFRIALIAIASFTGYEYGKRDCVDKADDRASQKTVVEKQNDSGKCWGYRCYSVGGERDSDRPSTGNWSHLKYSFSCWQVGCKAEAEYTVF